MRLQPHDRPVTCPPGTVTRTAAAAPTAPATKPASTPTGTHPKRSGSASRSKRDDAASNESKTTSAPSNKRRPRETEEILTIADASHRLGLFLRSRTTCDLVDSYSSGAGSASERVTSPGQRRSKYATTSASSARSPASITKVPVAGSPTPVRGSLDGQAGSVL